MPDAQILRKLALEPLDLGASDEALAVADARDRGEHLLPQRAVLRPEIQQRYGHGLDPPAGRQRLMMGAPQSGRSLRSSGGTPGPLARVFRTMSTSSPA